MATTLPSMARKAQRSSNAKRDRAKQKLIASREPWVPPDLADCDSDEVITEPDSTNRIIMRRVRWQGRLVSYAVIHVRLNNYDQWEEISCIDCCHGTVHRHSGRNNGKQPEIIRPITSQTDVQQSFNSSFDEIYDNYERLRDETWLTAAR